MKNLIIISTLIVICMGAGCDQSSDNNSQKNVQNKITTASSTTISNPFTTPGTKTFSDPDADFTFTYPDTWVYKKEIISQKDGSVVKSWGFSYQGKGVLSIGAPPSETAHDLCSGNDPVTRKHLLDFNVFSTNDPQTTVLEEMCTSCANENEISEETATSCTLHKLPYGGIYIYWVPGRRLRTASDLPSSEILAKKYHIMFLSFPFDEKGNPLATRDEFFNWIHRIAGSIKIVKK